MIRKWFGISALVLTACFLLNVSGCARNQHLVSINIQPGNGTFAAVDPTAYFLYKAYGSYVHPPKTIDITSQVTWQTGNPQVAHFTGAGVVSPNTNCGVAQIFATMHDSPNDIVSNQVSITVDGPLSSGCPQGTVTNTLSVNLSNATDGAVMSNPSGINCGNGSNLCAVSFPSGSSVALTASPNSGHTFAGWGGACASSSGNTCNVIMNGNVTVSATFN